MGDCLLDTHAFLWFINGSAEISNEAKLQIQDPQNKKFISIASFWEMAIKYSLGKLKLDIPFQELRSITVNNSIEILPLTFEHINKLTTLDFHHQDPFDRLVIAQALTENLPVISKDVNFTNYGVKLIW